MVPEFVTKLIADQTGKPALSQPVRRWGGTHPIPVEARCVGKNHRAGVAPRRQAAGSIRDRSQRSGLPQTGELAARPYFPVLRSDSIILARFRAGRPRKRPLTSR